MGSVAAGAILFPADTPLKNVLADLKAQATNGSPASACRLAFELERCGALKFYQQQASSAITRADEAGLFGDTKRRAVAAAEATQARFYRIQTVCEGVAEDETREAWRYILQAARAGHGPSMALYVARSGYLQGRAPLEVLDGWIALRDEGPEYLRRALEQGYPHAYYVAASGYAQGDYSGLRLPVDRPLAVAFAMSLDKAKGAPTEGWAGLEVFVTRRYTITPAEAARARELEPRLTQALQNRLKESGREPESMLRDDVRPCE